VAARKAQSAGQPTAQAYGQQPAQPSAQQPVQQPVQPEAAPIPAAAPVQPEPVAPLAANLQAEPAPEALPTEVIPPAEPAQTAPTEALPTEVFPPAEPAETAPTEALPTEVIPPAEPVNNDQPMQQFGQSPTSQYEPPAQTPQYPDQSQFNQYAPQYDQQVPNSQYGQQAPQYPQPQYPDQAQNNQYAQQYPGFAPTPGDPSGQYQYPYAPQPEPKKGFGAWLKAHKALTVIIAVVLVLALVAGTLWFTVFRKGANTPEAAVDGLLSGIAIGKLDDPIKMAIAANKFLAPSESGSQGLLLQQTEDLMASGTVQADLIADVTKVLQTITFELRDLVTETEELSEGLARVTVTGGTVYIDIDEDGFRAAVKDGMANQKDVVLRIADAFGFADDLDQDWPTDSQLDDEMDQMFEDVTFPYEADIDQVMADTGGINGYGDELSLMTVKEDGRWYVSSYLTQAETQFTGIAGRGGFEYGDLPADDVKGADSAAGAGENLLNAVADLTGDAEINTSELLKIADQLTYPERRVFYVYEDAFAELDGQSIDGTLTVDRAEFGNGPTEGNAQVITLDNIEFTYTAEDYYGDLETNTISITDNNCFSFDDGYSSGGGCLDELLDQAQDLVENELSQVSSNFDTQKISDAIQAVRTELDFSEIGLVAVNENGWKISLTQSVNTIYGPLLSAVFAGLNELAK
jgi:hypothetical protein